MQFLVIAHDGTDPGAAQRRQQARAAHLATAARLKAVGNFILGGAILNDAGVMIGSAIVFEFPDRDALDRCLQADPYVIARVWQHIDVQPFRVAQLPAVAALK
jgi:uncharacterized protein YciI